jgi:hypothetical protein
MAITGVDAEYMSNGEIMIGSLDYPDLISGSTEISSALVSRAKCPASMT